MKAVGKWWRGQRVICRACGEQIVLEDTDRPRSGKTYPVEVDCPVCGGVVNVPHKPHGAEVPRRPILAPTRDEEVARLLAAHASAGDRRDGDEADRIEAELYRLTGDPRWGPSVPEEE